MSERVAKNLMQTEQLPIVFEFYLFRPMDKKVSFYGTPLSRLLGDDKTNDDGPIQNRRARLNYQQTVRDDQGRQRFHGAFTGGFSAGYFNTVDSIGGFQPRQFISRRKTRQDESKSDFTHKPEDYMDEEDLGEFGIAPKKIRVIGSYSSIEEPRSSNNGNDFDFSRLFQSTAMSIGETILQRLSRGSDSKRFRIRDGRRQSHFDSISSKNDYHGLGYKPLESRDVSSMHAPKFSNPLMAVLDQGKRLRISGEAFGSGVLEDEGDFLDETNAYEYDNIRDYELKSKTSSKSKPKCDKPTSGEDLTSDKYDLPGFILAESLDAMKICDNVLNYPNPTIPEDWKMPTRSAPYIPQPNVSNISSDLHQSSSLFNRKFVQSLESSSSTNIETKAGLVLYSDLKASNERICETAQPIIPEKNIPSVSRVTMEWHPCSLLCKRFNVPNPYPDNSLAGVRTPNLINYCDKEDKCYDKFERPEKLAPMDLRRSIFNVKFVESNESDTEDEPQVIELSNSPVNLSCLNQSSDEDQDIIEVSTAKREPEVIVLSSSSSSPVDTSPNLRKIDQLTRLDTDTYGPPLPPSLKTLVNSDYLNSRSRSKKKKKSKKHKRH